MAAATTAAAAAGVSSIALDAREEMTPQQMLQVEAAMQPDPLVAPLLDRRIAAQLSYLASQHQLSEYNKLKYGINGAPGTYIPLSIQLPSHARDMRLYQSIAAESQLWWAAAVTTLTSTSHGSTGVESVEEAVKQRTVMRLEARSGSNGVDVNYDGLEEELGLALSSQLAPTPSNPPQSVVAALVRTEGSALGLKTSESHPINLSAMIPFDVLPHISAFMSKRPEDPSLPTFLKLPFGLRLDVITTPMQHQMQLQAHHNGQHASHSHHSQLQQCQPQSTGWLPPPTKVNKSTAPTSSVNASQTKRSSHDLSRNHPNFHLVIPPSVIQADLMSDQPTPPALASRESENGCAILPSRVPLPPSPAESSKLTSSYHTSNDINGARKELQRAHSGLQEVFTLNASAGAPPETASEMLQELQEATSSPLALPNLPNISISKPMEGSSRGRQSNHTNGASTLHPRLSNGSNGHSHHAHGSETHIPPMPPPPYIQSPNGDGQRYRGPMLGNLFLSSCPGKKVRLNGPVRGRGTIYRSITADLQRMKDFGVQCLVCCLDDTELEFLGAPWEEYYREASSLGLDVLRIPTPEGFAPIATEILNDQLDFLIRKYTLKGGSILVHCRGGVGRAGLVASCWMLKMGLCGWIDEKLQSKTNQNLNLRPKKPPVSALHQQQDQMHNELADLFTPPIQWDTVELVERVIRVVRRRRSVKAIETFEQVKFLVDFVDFLRRPAMVDTEMGNPGAGAGGSVENGHGHSEMELDSANDDQQVKNQSKSFPDISLSPAPAL